MKQLAPKKMGLADKLFIGFAIFWPMGLFVTAIGAGATIIIGAWYIFLLAVGIICLIISVAFHYFSLQVLVQKPEKPKWYQNMEQKWRAEKEAKQSTKK